MSHRTKAYLMLLASVAIWGIAGVVIKNTLAYFDPVVFLTYRFLITSSVLIPILFVAHKHTLQSLVELSAKQWILMTIAGLLGTTIQLLLLFSGLRMTTAIDGVLISSTSPIFSAIAASIFLKDHVTKREKIGLAIATIGSIVTVIQPILATGRIFSGNTLGNLLVLAGNFSWVAYILLAKTQLRHHQSPIFITTFNFFVGFISMFFVLIFTTSPAKIYSQLSTHNFSAHLGVAYMALISGALAYFLFHKAERSIEASEADVFLYLQPVFATPLAIFWLGEPLTIHFLISAALIALGVTIAGNKSHSRL